MRSSCGFCDMRSGRAGRSGAKELLNREPLNPEPNNLCTYKIRNFLVTHYVVIRPLFFQILRDTVPYWCGTADAFSSPADSAS